MAIKVQVTHLATGQVHVFPSMKAAAEQGGFIYNIVQQCVRGAQASHAGHVFKALTSPGKRRGTATRVHQVGRLLTDGMNYAAIADRLGVKVPTVKHLSARARSLGLAPAVAPNGRPIA